MSSRETFKIGPVEIPKITFPENFGEVLRNYLTAGNDDLGYVAMYGIERPELLRDAATDTRLLRLYAALNFFKAGPDNGLAVFEIVSGLADLNDADGAKLVLESLEQSKGLGLYPVWYEDPMFHLGWCMADFRRYGESIDAYRKSLSKPLDRGKWAIWTHLGSVFHELADFQHAGECYQHALQSIESEVHPASFDSPGQSAVINRLIEQAKQQQPYGGERSQFGIELKYGNIK
jgi:tetratricopeptide (TPR) repeat protein